MDLFSQQDFEQSAKDIVQISHTIHSRHWSPATSSNYSIRLNNNVCAITTSGKDKGQLNNNEVMAVNLQGKALSEGKPSAETLLHTSLYTLDANIGAILHTHSKNSTVLSRLIDDTHNKLSFHGYEILKAFSDINSHEETLCVPVFNNNQNMRELSNEVTEYLNNLPKFCYGYLIRGHGVYVWGHTINEAMRHLEALEFLLECECELKRIKG